MYDNSRLPSYTNVSSRPCRLQSSRWSLDTPTSSSQSSQQSSGTLSSSFYFPHPQPIKQVLTPTYVNYYPPPSSVSSMHSSNYERPRSTILCESNGKTQSTFHVNDLRQRYESRAVVGVVKPMVQHRSHPRLIQSNNESKIAEMIMMSTKPTDAYYHNSLRSLHPATPSLSSSTSSVIYRTRPPLSQSIANGQPPIAPRRYSSVSTTKCPSSHRSSRTTSTSSSIVGVTELASRIPSHELENGQKQQPYEESIVVDIKRLEMFYGSVGTLVKSARSTARLFITTTRQLANFEDWSCQQLGVPVWIYNTGANLKRTRQVRLILAQHDNCFTLWSSLVSEQAELRLPKENYITCWLPDTNMLVVFKFEHEDACRLFFRHYYEILQNERRMNLANPPPLPAENTSERPPHPQQQHQPQSHAKEIPRRYSRFRTISTKPDKEQEQQQFELRRCRSLSKIRTVKKSDISGPINFEHVNHISVDCHQPSRPLSGTVTLRSLHASMSHLPNTGTGPDRLTNSNKKRASTSFEPRTTAV